MARRVIKSLECDLCGVEGEDVETHTLSIDGGKLIEVESCDLHWPRQALATLLEKGRLVKRS